ncbi:hypothetical protein GRJ2_001414100 [Grus japonensis]|uniref:Uncharacterized protein n=1 Tax=Grus japonensis TaxID=30415 RepID=A0ABC9WVS5_GRUJA
MRSKLPVSISAGVASGAKKVKKIQPDSEFDKSGAKAGRTAESYSSPVHRGTAPPYVQKVLLLHIVPLNLNTTSCQP